MLEIPEKIKDILRQDNSSPSTARNIKMVFFDGKAMQPDQQPSYVIENDQISHETMTIIESLCESDNLIFGECNAAQFEIVVADVLIDLTGKEFVASMTVCGYEVPLGIYRVKSFIRQADRRMKKITAYNRMADFMVDISAWYRSLTFPMTLKQFRDSLCRHIGIEQVAIELPLDDMQVAKTIDPEQLSGIDVLQAICEINGCFGQVNKYGKVNYVYMDKSGLYPAEDLFPDDNLYPIDFREGKTEQFSHYKKDSTTYEDYLVNSIDRVQIRQEEGDIGAIYGPEGNCYVIQGNFLVYGKNANELLEIAATVYNQISGISYRPCRISAPALPWVEPGDGIICYTTDDVIETYCLKRTMKGIQRMMDTYEATGNVDLEDNFGIHMQIIQLEGKTATIVKNVDEVSARVTDLKSDTEAQFKVTAGQISAEVQRAKSEEGKLSASIKINAEAITSKVTSGQVESIISQKADSIRLKASKISWSSTNSSMTEDGTLTCKNGNFSGTITSFHGRIGGFDIDGNSLSSFSDDTQITFGEVIIDNTGLLAFNWWFSDTEISCMAGIIANDDGDIFVHGSSYFDGWTVARALDDLRSRIGSGGCSSDSSCDDCRTECSCEGNCDEYLECDIEGSGTICAGGG